MIRRPMFCTRCKIEVSAIIEFGLDGAGKKVRAMCPNGDHRVNKMWESVKEYTSGNWENLDFNYCNTPCSICGSFDRVQDHHYFPKHVFGLEIASKGTIVPLCHYHHIELWHNKLTPNMTHKDMD